MYKSQFQKNDPYDWFCGPGSHMYVNMLGSAPGTACKALGDKSLETQVTINELKQKPKNNNNK